jgi:hypothetical protein
MNSEKKWREFKGYRLIPSSNLFRLNTQLEDPIPELHEVNRLEELELVTQRYWSVCENTMIIKKFGK